MVRTVIITDRERHKCVLSFRVDAKMTQHGLLEKLRQAVSEFREQQPESYERSLGPDRKFQWPALWTHMDEGILLKHGIEVVGFGDCWLEISDLDNNPFQNPEQNP